MMAAGRGHAGRAPATTGLATRLALVTIVAKIHKCESAPALWVEIGCAPRVSWDRRPLPAGMSLECRLTEWMTGGTFRDTWGDLQ